MRITESERGFIISAFLALGLLALLVQAAHAGDSLYGKVTAIKHANLVTIDYGSGTYDIRLAGIELPDNRAILKQATDFVSKMLLEKPARLRFEGRNPDGEMIGRIYTDDPEIGIKDVGIEMVRAGLAMPQRGYEGDKYGELAKAMEEARTKKTGIWSESQ